LLADRLGEPLPGQQRPVLTAQAWPPDRTTRGGSTWPSDANTGSWNCLRDRDGGDQEYAEPPRLERETINADLELIIDSRALHRWNNSGAVGPGKPL